MAADEAAITVLFAFAALVNCALCSLPGTQYSSTYPRAVLEALFCMGDDARVVVCHSRLPLTV